MLKQMNNCPKDYICIFIVFMFKKTKTYIQPCQSGWKCYNNVAQKNVTTTNDMLKNLDIMSLRYIYIYIYIYIYLQ